MSYKRQLNGSDDTHESPSVKPRMARHSRVHAALYAASASPRAGGGKSAYRAHVRLKGHNECQTFTSRRAAESWAKSVESAIDEGRTFPHGARRTTFGELVEGYTATKLARMSTKERTTRTRKSPNRRG